MRQIAPLLVVASALALAVPATADAPRSLGAIAAEKEAKEKEKDKKKPPAKVFTEADLHGGRAGSGTVSRPAADGVAASPAAGDQKAASDQKAPAGPAGEKPKTEEEQRAERVNDWRSRMEKMRAEVVRLTDVVSRLQASMNDMSGPLYGSGRAARQGQLDEAKRSLATAQEQVTALEEEGRRNSYR